MTGVRVRVAGLVFAGERVLVVEHQLDGERWCCFPGGSLELGETPEQGVHRELAEELGLACEVGPLVAIGYHQDDSGQSVELYFRCTAGERELVSRSEAVVSARFVHPSELPALRVFPLELSDALAGDRERALGSVRYFGRFR
jgi:ADP-ribose pyrophosphatase YjhB (NUDIX family)